MPFLSMADIHRRFDGPIPRAEMAAAEHEAPGARIARTNLRPSLKPHIVLGLMAGVIVDVVKARGTVTEADLLSHGFTADQIRQLGDRAKAMAAPQLPADRQVA